MAGQHIGVQPRQPPQFGQRRILLEHHLAVGGGENLQRVPLPDALGAADFFGNHDTTEFIPLCQVGAKKFYKLSEKPLISMALGFPDGATMHLRGFDRLCYFRSKFDRFAPKGNIGVNSQLRCFHRCRFSIR